MDFANTGLGSDQISVKLEGMVTRKLRPEDSVASTRPTMPAPPAPARLEEIDESGVFHTVYSQADIAAKIGGFDRVPLVRMTPNEIRELPIDPTTAYLIGQMDGMMTVEMLIDMAPVTKEEVLRSLCQLVDHGVITIQ